MLDRRLPRARTDDRNASHRFDRAIIVLVVIGVAWDWVPATYFDLPPEQYSLNKLLVQPLIGLHLFARLSAYLDFRRTWPAWLWLVSLVLGMGSGVLAGTVGLDRLIGVLPVAPIFLFFLAIRRDADRLLAMRWLFYTAALVPITVCLGYAGIIEPSLEIFTAQGLFRQISGPNWSSLSQFLVIPVAFLAGLPLLVSRERTGTAGLLVAGIGVFIVLACAITAQRASIVGVAATMLMVLAAASVRRAGGRVPIWLAVVVVVIGGGYALTTAMPRQTEIAVSRWSVEELQDTGREGTLAIFWEEFTDNPSFIPPGMSVALLELGVGMHFLFGEAYFDGGALVLLALVFLVVRGLAHTLRASTDQSVENAQIALVLGITICAWMLCLSFNPGLQTRLIYLGLGLANGLEVSTLGRRRRGRARSQIPMRATVADPEVMRIR